MQVASTVTDVKTGAVIAQIGGRRGSKVIPRPLTNLLELSSPTLIKVLTATIQIVKWIKSLRNTVPFQVWFLQTKTLLVILLSIQWLFGPVIQIE